MKTSAKIQQLLPLVAGGYQHQIIEGIWKEVMELEHKLAELQEKQVTPEKDPCEELVPFHVQRLEAALQELSENIFCEDEDCGSIEDRLCYLEAEMSPAIRNLQEAHSKLDRQRKIFDEYSEKVHHMERKMHEFVEKHNGLNGLVRSLELQLNKKHSCCKVKNAKT